jgi:flagellar biosynthesis/type III secretory pathway protein FliH
MRLFKIFIVILILGLTVILYRSFYLETAELHTDENVVKWSNTKNYKSENEMENEIAPTDRAAKFHNVLEASLQKRNLKKEDICDAADAVQIRILNDYGAVFLASDAVRVPPVCMFSSEEEVNKFQSSVIADAEEIDGALLELQAEAMKAYREARREARAKGLDITPRDGTEAGRRSFADTLRLWNSRFEPACKHWQNKGKLSPNEVENLKSLPVKEQVKQVLELEKRGIFFNTYFNNSILYSVAAPGASQHLSMLALDVNEYENKKVREILNKHGWFRTVKNDAPHFTFLGYKEKELKQLGLKKIDGDFWVPNV